MFDRHVLPYWQRLFIPLARFLYNKGIEPDVITTIGFCVGCLGCLFVCFDYLVYGFGLFVFSRLADTLDGMVARLRGATKHGAFLDISCDFVLYSLFPLSFAVADNSVAFPALVLVFSFVCSGTSFLASAIFVTSTQIKDFAKGFTYVPNLAEGLETFVVFCFFVAFPQFFAWFAYVFSGLCFMSAGVRCIQTYMYLRSQ